MDNRGERTGPRYRLDHGQETPYQTITVHKLTPAVGAEIGGVDISQPIGNHQMTEIHRALAENQAIFFRDQNLSIEQHLAFGHKFGEIQVHPFAPHSAGHPEVMKVHADQDSSFVAGDETWHSDMSFESEPPMGSILQIKICPPQGGDTLFASMYAAYDALSARMKTYLDGLTAVHDGAQVQRELYGTTKASYPRAEHPVVRTHPVTGRKALYVNRSFTRRINGISIAESDGILSFLFTHMENPTFQCRFRWRPNSVAFWDNRCVQHRALWDYWPGTRSGFRVTVRGEKPV